MPKEVTDLALRKKMRKGTHSCFECRRRKIRCVFPSDNPDVCSECFARGSRCVDQENANPDVIVDNRKNLRERVSRLEALIDSLLEEKTERSQADTISVSSRTPNLVTRDTFPPTPLSSEASSQLIPDNQRAQSERGHHIPFLSVFEDALNDAEERIKAQMDSTTRKDSIPAPVESPGERFTVTCTNGEDMLNDNSATYQARKERAKQGLLSVLPAYDKLTKIFNTNTEWWQTWRLKCSGTSAPDETLAQFASKAIAESNIGAMGTLVLSVGISTADDEDVNRYIEAVDRWVLSDDEYAATLEGMECLILKAKWYADVGQPRRAWLAHRKGLMYCQLMGLHRKRTTSPAHESIWWALYHGDRFLSLLLGLPYGISDNHCDLTLPDTGGEYMAPLNFFNKLSVLSGKVIDRNQGFAEQSFAWALQLDQELEDLWKKLDPNWLEYNVLLADIENNAADLRERLMAQMVYHQIRVYLHLPFMLKSQVNSRFTYSRTACLNGSREVLRLYQALRTGEVQPLYECKAVDFIGFTSAVLIMIGLFNCTATNTPISPKDQEADIRLIEMSIDIFRRASSEKGGRVALQSAEVLEKMLKKFKMDFGHLPGGEDHCSEPPDFVIPYFGTISIKRGGIPAKPSVCGGSAVFKQANRSISSSSPSQFTPTSETTGSDLFGTQFGASTTSTNTAATSTDATFNLSGNDPFVSYDGFYNFPTSGMSNANSTTGGSTLGAQVNDDSMNNFPLPTNNFSWQNMPMDIDQDWSWFLNDTSSAATPLQTAATGSGNTAATTGQQGGTLPDQFSQQTFVGF